MPGMICAPEAIAADIGAEVLAKGGNSVDAAVTCALAQGVLNPHNSSIGGYLVVNMHRNTDPFGMSRMIDAPARAGSGTSADMWASQYLGPNPDNWGFFLRSRANELGYTSICTPGTIRGLHMLLERWGTLSFSEAAEPAARLAETGIPVDERVASYWRMPAAFPEQTAMVDYVRANPEASRIYLKTDGQPYVAGEIIRNPDYARTLRELGDHPETFYRGTMSDRIMADLGTNGAFVTADDLLHYEAAEPTPIVGRYRDVTFATTTAPHGGPTLVEIMNIMEGWDVRSMGHNSAEYILKMAAAMKASFADRNTYLGDTDFVDVPVEWMTSKDRAAEWRERIERGEEIVVPFDPVGSPGTTHVSVVDGRGSCVALTHSLGGSSGVITPGMGFMYNNSMINYHPLPGHPNSIAPRKARTTGMAPTIVYNEEGRPILVIGAPGGTRIITSIAQVLVNIVDFKMSVSDAVHAARFDCQAGAISAQIRIPGRVVDEVARKHPVKRLPFGHGGIGLVHAIAINQVTGRLTGGADTGSDGMAIAL